MSMLNENGVARTSAEKVAHVKDREKNPRLKLVFKDKTRTKQEMKDECDINAILKRHGITNVMVQGIQQAREYGIATSMTYKESMDIYTSALTMFANLPSAIRKRFNADPGEYLAFIEDPENRREAAELGLLSDEAVIALRAEIAKEALDEADGKKQPSKGSEEPKPKEKTESEDSEAQEPT